MSEEKDLSLGKRWFMAVVIYLVMFAAFYNQFKAPGLFSQIVPSIGFMGLGVVNVGWMMSMFSFLGLIFAFPATWIIHKLGIKKTLVFTIICLVVGSALGAIATSPYVLLFSRFIEGGGVGFLSVVAPSALAVLIPKKQRGLAFGLQGITFPAGTVIGMNVSTIIGSAMGWRAAWWVGAALALVIAILLVWFKLPPELDRPGAREFTKIDDSIKPDWRSIIVVSIVYMLWNVIWVGAFNSFYSTFLQQTFSMAAPQASFMTTVTSLMMIVLGAVTGIVSDKLHTRKWLIVFCMIGSAIMLTFGWNDSLACVWIFLIGEGIFAPCVTTGVMSIVPELAKRPDKISVGMSTMAFFKSAGMVVGSAIYAPIVAVLGYANGSLFFLAPMALIAGLLCIFLVRETRPGKEQPATEAAAKSE